MRRWRSRMKIRIRQTSTQGRLSSLGPWIRCWIYIQTTLGQKVASMESGCHSRWEQLCWDGILWFAPTWQCQCSMGLEVSFLTLKTCLSSLILVESNFATKPKAVLLILTLRCKNLEASTPRKTSKIIQGSPSSTVSSTHGYRAAWTSSTTTTSQSSPSRVLLITWIPSCLKSLSTARAWLK